MKINNFGNLFQDYGDLLTVNEVAEITHMSPQHIRALVRSGKIPATKIGYRQWFVAKSALAKMFELDDEEDRDEA